MGADKLKETDKYVRKNRVKLLALVVSVLIHVVALSALTIAEFSQSAPAVKQPQQPTITVNRIKEFTEMAAVTVKPKVKRPMAARLTTSPQGQSVSGKVRLTTAELIDRKTTDNQKSNGHISNDFFSIPVDRVFPVQVELFGCRVNQRKICYLVDCSGSMKGILPRVKKELKKSIASLQQDQYFAVIFFGGGKIHVQANATLLRASNDAKSSAYNFIDSIAAGGRTDTLEALERAVKIRDKRRRPASVIYLLTDGFELASENSVQFEQKAVTLLKRFAPGTKINAIGFWPQNNDREMLESLAEKSGGAAVFITDNHKKQNTDYSSN